MAIVLDGTTGITTPTIAATSASTFTGALALPAGGLNVGSGQLAVDASGRVTMASQPNFRATNGSGNIVAKADIIFTSVDWNVAGGYNTSTGRFTAPITGYYLFCLTALYQNAGSSPTWKLNLLKNGAFDCVIGESQANIYGGTYNTILNGSQIVYMVAGDYVNLYNDGTTTISSMHISGSQTKFSGYLLG